MEEKAQEQMINRLKRSEGQVKAVIRMIEEKRDPKQIMMQVNALIASVETTKVALVEEFTKAKIMESISALSELLK